MQWKIYCDFDGTITRQDVTDSLLQRFASPEWLDIEDEWKAGAIGSRECMTRQVALIRTDRSRLDGHLDSIEIDPAFPDFVRLCRAPGIPITVVSDGFDYAIERILGRYGLSDIAIVSNHLRQIDGDHYCLEFPFARDDCRARSGTCKCAVASGGESHRRRLLIGDGHSDFCVAAEADLIFAKKSLLDHCQRQRLPHVAFTDFTDAARLLRGLLDIGRGRDQGSAVTNLQGPAHD